MLTFSLGKRPCSVRPAARVPSQARREFRSEMQNFIWKKSPNSRGRFAVRHELNYWKAAAKTATVSEEEAMQLMPPGARATRAPTQGRWLCECFGKIRSVSWQSRGNSELMCVFQLAQWSLDLYEQMQTHALNAEPDNGKVQLCWLSEDSADAATLQRLALPWEDSVAILIPILETGDGCGICAVPVGVIPKTFVNSRRVPAALARQHRLRCRGAPAMPPHRKLWSLPNFAHPAWRACGKSQAVIGTRKTFQRKAHQTLQACCGMRRIFARSSTRLQPARPKPPKYHALQVGLRRKPLLRLLLHMLQMLRQRKRPVARRSGRSQAAVAAAVAIAAATVDCGRPCLVPRLGPSELEQSGKHGWQKWWWRLLDSHVLQDKSNAVAVFWGACCNFRPCGEGIAHASQCSMLLSLARSLAILRIGRDL